MKEFQPAAQLDPHFFEAQMNLAAINLSFRGFDKAEGAYRKALEMHPNDYDAHLGLALALRGQIDDSNYDKQVAAVQARARRLQEARRRAPRRLLQRGHPHAGVQGEGRRRHGQGRSPSTSRPSRSSRRFMDKASGKAEYDGAVKKAKERMQDIDDTITFLQAGGPAAGHSCAACAAAPAPAATPTRGCGAGGLRRRRPLPARAPRRSGGPRCARPSRESLGNLGCLAAV